jgi:hypothetical protein
MHKIHSKELGWDDFSAEHIHTPFAEQVFDNLLDALDNARKNFLETKSKEAWNELIQLLPTSYNQKRTIMLNYEVLVNIYHSRKNHKLDEWHVFCDWIESLPYSELITGGDSDV